MIPAAFSYQRAGSVDEALDLVAEHGEDAADLVSVDYDPLPAVVGPAAATR